MLGLQIRYSKSEPPLQVDRAIVHWHLTTYLGMEFLALASGEEERLSHLLNKLEKETTPIP
jgi:hypothetical protein